MPQKSFFKKLEKGQIHSAVVEEILSSEEAICSFQGNLLRIANRTNIKMKVGDSIRLQIRSVEPLEFQIFDLGSPKFERVV